WWPRGRAYSGERRRHGAIVPLAQHPAAAEEVGREREESGAGVFVSKAQSDCASLTALHDCARRATARSAPLHVLRKRPQAADDRLIVRPACDAELRRVAGGHGEIIPGLDCPSSGPHNYLRAAVIATSISLIVRGMSLVSTREPVFVTSTSSSMRTPIP